MCGPDVHLAGNRSELDIKLSFFSQRYTLADKSSRSVPKICRLNLEIKERTTRSILVAPQLFLSDETRNLDRSIDPLGNWASLKSFVMWWLVTFCINWCFPPTPHFLLFRSLENREHVPGDFPALERLIHTFTKAKCGSSFVTTRLYHKETIQSSCRFLGKQLADASLKGEDC